MKQLYWDEGNGEVTTDSDFAPIFANGNVYIETYELLNHDSNVHISISYTQDMKDSLDLELVRENLAQSMGCKRSDFGKLLRLGIPTDKYKKLMEVKE